MLDKIDLNKMLDKATYKRMVPELRQRAFSMQKASWDAGIPVILLFEGWDAAGKGTSVQRLTRSLDPRGYKLYPIRAVRTYEMKYPWLWRFWLKLPARGEWAIFDRSWYGRVMVERVEKIIPESQWRLAYRDIVDFERTLVDDGHLIIKFFLHISKREQRRRFDNLAQDPMTAWQVTGEDWDQHRNYDRWLLAYEEAFERTETEWGPWTIVGATDRRYTWVKIYRTVITAIEDQLGLPHKPFLSDTVNGPTAPGQDETMAETDVEPQEDQPESAIGVRETVTENAQDVASAENEVDEGVVPGSPRGE